MSELQLWRQAEAWMAAGRLVDAGNGYAQLAHSPSFAPVARLRLSLISSQVGRLRDATEHALAAYRVRQNDADLMAMLSKRLFSLGEIEKAIECATAPVVMASSDPALMAEMGKLMSDAFEPASALTLLRRARALGADSAGMNYLMGICLMYCGERDEAKAELLACLQKSPHYARAFWALSKLSGRSGDGERIDVMRQALAQETDPAARVLLGYALFKELDAPGNEGAAWQLLDQAMRTRRSLVQYSSEEEGKLFEFLHQQALPLAVAASAPQGPQPVFIVGMPRTGTSLLEGLLARHPDVTDAGELHDFVLQLRWECDLPGDAYLDLALAQRAASADFVRLGQRYLAHTQWRAGNARWYTDKMPTNHFNVGYIAAALPHARIIHMQREPMDTCFSSLKEPFAGAYPHSYDQVEMATHFLRYRKLMAHWHHHMPGRILDVEYEKLVQQPEATMARVLDFLELRNDQNIAGREGVAGALTTASANQLREGVHSRYVGQYERYADYLSPLRQALSYETN